MTQARREPSNQPARLAWDEVCENCGGRLHFLAGQVVSDGHLRWFRSRSCDGCGEAIEEDGLGIDAELHAALLEAEGGESLLLTPDATSRRAAFVTVRDLLGVPLGDWHALAKLHPSCVARGTRAEMEWLRQRLERTRGIVATIAHGPTP